MCGGGDKATEAAQRAETERKQQVAAATQAIDRAFAGRTGQLDDFIAALRGEFTTEAQRQKLDADRQLKFSLARGGLTGGSAAADAGIRSGEEFQKGLLKGERLSQASLADLVSADEASRQNLIALAQSGATVGTAAKQSANALRANLSKASAEGLTQSLGDIFGETRSLFTRQQEAAERRRGLRESELFAAPFSRST
jgi:hypothetical protein